MASTRVLTAADVATIVRSVGLDAVVDDLIDRLSDALVHHDPEILATIDRAGFDYVKPDVGLIEWMPAMEHGRRVSIKVVGYHPSNPVERLTPTIQAVTSLFDTADGRLISMCESSLLTALRTGAASAIASDVLTVLGPVTVGIVGCGAQAVSQLHALSRVRPIERVLAYDTDTDVAATFRSRVPVAGGCIEVLGADQLSVLTTEADIICTVTSVGVGDGPVFTDVGLRSGLHINAVGSDFPGKLELPRSLLRRALVCPDVVEQCLREGESQQLERAMLGPDLADLVRNKANWIGHRETLTVFDSTGWALEDLVAAEMMLDHAQRLGVGLDIELHLASNDPYDVYEAVRG